MSTDTIPEPAAQQPTSEYGDALVGADAGVHLHLRGSLDEDAVTALREQLAACLGAGIRHITVHVERQPDLELATLQVLQGAARYLKGRGGSLVLTGAQPTVLRRLAINEMTDLLAPQEVASKTVAAPAAEVSWSASSGARGRPAPRRSPPASRTARPPGGSRAA